MNKKDSAKLFLSAYMKKQEKKKRKGDESELGGKKSMKKRVPLTFFFSYLDVGKCPNWV